jgi:hypothetical protein
VCKWHTGVWTGDWDLESELHSGGRCVWECELEADSIFSVDSNKVYCTSNVHALDNHKPLSTSLHLKRFLTFGISFQKNKPSPDNDTSEQHRLTCWHKCESKLAHALFSALLHRLNPTGCQRKHFQCSLMSLTDNPWYIIKTPSSITVTFTDIQTLIHLPYGTLVPISCITFDQSPNVVHYVGDRMPFRTLFCMKTCW